jgi:hypothetical protein
MAELAALVECFDLVRGQVALFGGQQHIRHGSLLNFSASDSITERAGCARGIF